MATTNRKTTAHELVSAREDEIAAKIVDAAFAVHNRLGPGLLEKVYEICSCHELRKRGLSCKRQVAVPIVYDNITFDEGLQLDVSVEDLVICEVKAADKPNPVWEAQLLSYMRLTGKRLGFIVNFNVALIRDGIKRMVL